MPKTTQRITIVRMIESRGTASSRSRSRNERLTTPAMIDDQQNRQAGLPVGVDEAHRQQGGRKCAERADADHVADDRGDQRTERQQQQHPEHLVHRHRQPRQVENLDRMALAGAEHAERRLDADDRIFGGDFRGRGIGRPADRRRGGRERSSSAE